MKEEAIKALKQFGREDLIDSPYGYDIDDNIEIFMTIRQMIKYNNLQSQLKEKEDLLKEICEEVAEYVATDGEIFQTSKENIYEILSKGENK